MCTQTVGRGGRRSLVREAPQLRTTSRLSARDAAAAAAAASCKTLT